MRASRKTGSNYGLVGFGLAAATNSSPNGGGRTTDVAEEEMDEGAGASARSDRPSWRKVNKSMYRGQRMHRLGTLGDALNLGGRSNPIRLGTDFTRRRHPWAEAIAQVLQETELERSFMDETKTQEMAILQKCIELGISPESLIRFLDSIGVPSS